MLKRIISAILSFTIILGGVTMATSQNAEAKTKYAHELDAQAYDGKDLGATYSKEKTVFKVWAPTASKVALRRYKTGSDSEPGAKVISTLKMSKGENGVWSRTVTGDIKDTYYTYLVTVDGKTKETVDIYAKAVGVNGNRGMVVDLDSTDPNGWDKDKHVTPKNNTDAVVWEVHVRDFSISPDSGVTDANKGKYLAFTEKGTTLNNEGVISTGIDYLKKLGITHVQLLPVFDYATVDEASTEDQFNWGYDPKNYNVPEGSYSTNPYDGNVRINEFKQMVQALHEANIGVIMDVVYNHTFTAENGWFENTVPGYYYRMNADGSYSDGAACGNETASDHLMYRKFMIDSVLYWANEYHIDGFRFDLMGIHDVDTMNMIRAELNKLDGGKNIIMYGEPWSGGTIGTTATTAMQSNVSKLNSNIGAFNDKIRDAIKGHVFDANDKGFVQGAKKDVEIIDGICANTIGNSLAGWAKRPSQSVTYTTAHDNYTLYDKLVYSVKNDGSYDERDEALVDMNKLSAAIVLTSQGISFMQAGEEFARTKQGDSNSYASPTEINRLDWSSLIKYRDLVSYYSGLIEIRKNFSAFRDPTTKAIESMAFSESESDGVVAYTVENTAKNEWSQAAVIFNSQDSEQTVTLKAKDGKALPGEWVIIADKNAAGVKSLGTVKGSEVKVPACSAMVLVDKESFDKAKITTDKCKVTIEHKDKASGEVLSSQVYTGNEGESYSSSINNSLLLEYDADSVDGEQNGKFTKEDQTVTYYYNKFSGAVTKLTVNYFVNGNDFIGSEPIPITDPVITTNREGESYSTSARSFDGYELDVTKLPTNNAGKYTDQDIVVNYYYNRVDSKDLVINYYNKNGWKNVGAYVYTLNDEGKKTLLAGKMPGTKMEKSDEDGWYTLTVEKTNSAYVIFTNMAEKKAKTDKGESDKGYKVKGTVWIKDDTVTYSGKVTTIYMDPDGKVLDTKVITGKADGKNAYKTTAKEYEEYEPVGTPQNAEGLFSEEDIYVIYNYKSKYIVPAFVTPVVIGCSAAAIALFCAATVTGIATRKRRAKRAK